VLSILFRELRRNTQNFFTVDPAGSEPPIHGDFREEEEEEGWTRGLEPPTAWTTTSVSSVVLAC